MSTKSSTATKKLLEKLGHRDFAALTESVYKLELLLVALYDADDQKATTCTSVTSRHEMLPR